MDKERIFLGGLITLLLVTIFIVSGCTTGYSIQESTKEPEETKCIPNWQCTSWDPAICPSTKKQTRTCIDINECGTTENKPKEEQICEYVVTYENTREGITLVIQGYTFEKISESYGKITDITFTIINNGGLELWPDLIVYIYDDEYLADSESVDEIDLTDIINEGDILHRKIPLDMSVAGIDRTKKFKVTVYDYGEFKVSVEFETDLTEGFK